MAQTAWHLLSYSVHVQPLTFHNCYLDEMIDIYVEQICCTKFVEVCEHASGGGDGEELSVIRCISI